MLVLYQTLFYLKTDPKYKGGDAGNLHNMWLQLFYFIVVINLSPCLIHKLTLSKVCITVTRHRLFEIQTTYGFRYPMRLLLGIWLVAMVKYSTKTTEGGIICLGSWFQRSQPLVLGYVDSGPMEQDIMVAGACDRVSSLGSTEEARERQTKGLEQWGTSPNGTNLLSFQTLSKEQQWLRLSLQCTRVRDISYLNHYHT